MSRRQARQFAEGVHAKFPNKMLAYNCSPSFNWEKNLDKATIASFQQVWGFRAPEKAPAQLCTDRSKSGRAGIIPPERTFKQGG